MKTIDEIRKELKYAIWPDDIIILKSWADSIIQECANSAQSAESGYWSDEVYLSSHFVDKESILKVKDQL